MPATYKPGRLARTLGRITPGPYFNAHSNVLGTLTDSGINTITIHRGKAGRGGGLHPSTLEITVPAGPVGEALGTKLRIEMDETKAAALGARLGVPGREIASRYYGRLGQVSVTDTGRRQQTTYGAGSYANRLNRSPKKRTPKAGQSLKQVIGNLMTYNDAYPVPNINLKFFGEYDTLAADSPEPVTYKDAIAKYAGDLGILIRETRAGELQVLPLPYRINDAAARLAGALPLTRSQAISPATWEQRNEWAPAVVEFLYTNTENKLITGVSRPDSPYLEEPEEVLTYDWSYIKSSTEQLYRNAWGIRKETNPQYYSVPSVTVDLLYLIGSNKQYHREQAGQLLAMEAGDPVYFAPDWPIALRGVHTAEGITETISANQWTLELSLVPYEHALGANTPAVPGRTWDSAGNTWDNDTRKWNEA